MQSTCRGCRPRCYRSAPWWRPGAPAGRSAAASPCRGWERNRQQYKNDSAGKWDIIGNQVIWKPAESTLGSSVRGELELDWMVVWLHIEWNINKNNQISWNVKKWKTLAPSPSTVVTFQPEQRGTGARHCGRWEIQKYTENRTLHMLQVINDEVHFKCQIGTLCHQGHSTWHLTQHKFLAKEQRQISLYVYKYRQTNKWVYD